MMNLNNKKFLPFFQTFLHVCLLQNTIFECEKNIIIPNFFIALPQEPQTVEEAVPAPAIIPETSIATESVVEPVPVAVAEIVPADLEKPDETTEVAENVEQAQAEPEKKLVEETTAVDVPETTKESSVEVETAVKKTESVDATAEKAPAPEDEKTVTDDKVVDSDKTEKV